MKKIFALALAILMLLCLAACNQTSGDDVPQITIGAQQNDSDKTPESNTSEATDDAQADAVYAFLYEGITLQPGTPFDASALPEPASTYTVPSCALEGTDNVYNYETFEVTAYDEGKGEFIYSVYILDPNLTTPEGLALGDTLDKVTALYGDGYTQESTSYTYTAGNTMLVIILQNDTIASIEYRMVTE